VTRKKTLTATPLASSPGGSDQLDDLPVKIVSDPIENPEEDPDEDDDSEEADEAGEPDEDKHSSSGQEDSGGGTYTGPVRKELNIPGTIRSGNIPVVPGELDDEGKPIRPMRTDREIAGDLRKKDLREKDGKSLCRHKNDLETCSYGCGTKRVPIDLSPTRPKEKSIPATTAEQLTGQSLPQVLQSPLVTVAQLSAAWIRKPKGRVIPKSERKITREALGISSIQILEWLDRVVDVSTVIEWDQRPVLKPAPADSCPDLEKELAAVKDELETRTQQHKDLTAAGQKRAAAMGQQPFDPKRRTEFMQIAYRAKTAAAERMREIQTLLRGMKKSSEDWGSDINHWTAERIPESRREVTVEHRLRDAFRWEGWEYDDPKQYDRWEEDRDGHMHIVVRDLGKRYQDFVELRDAWEEDPSLWIPTGAPGECFYVGGTRRVELEREVIVCAYLLRWYEPPQQLIRKFPRLRDLEKKRLGTAGWPKDLDTEAEDIGAEESQSILKDGGASAQMTVHGKTWTKLKTFETFTRMTYGSKDEDGGGFYGEIDYEGEDE
jgi:hypothetical protein